MVNLFPIKPKLFVCRALHCAVENKINTFSFNLSCFILLYCFSLLISKLKPRQNVRSNEVNAFCFVPVILQSEANSVHRLKHSIKLFRLNVSNDQTNSKFRGNT